MVNPNGSGAASSEPAEPSETSPKPSTTTPRMTASKPPWWRAFDKVERMVGKPLEDAVASRRYVDVVTLGMKVHRAVGGKVGQVAAGALERAWHVARVPTRDDVRRLSREIAVLTSEVRALKTAQQAEEAAQSPRKRRTAAQKQETDDDAT